MLVEAVEVWAKLAVCASTRMTPARISVAYWGKLRWKFFIEIAPSQDTNANIPACLCSVGELCVPRLAGGSPASTSGDGFFRGCRWQVAMQSFLHHVLSVLVTDPVAGRITGGMGRQLTNC